MGTKILDEEIAENTYFTGGLQRFHNERAIYLTEHLGYEVHDIQGYNAADPTSKMALMTYVREYFARVKVFVDILTGK